MEEENKFYSTISESREESIKKALEILNAESVESKITRPKTKLIIILLKIFLIAFIEILLVICSIYNFIENNTYLFFVELFFLALFIIIFTKHLLINLVLLYQKVASESLRKSCLFEPTCSEYMILAIRKYGTVRGFIKGIKRILRCHYPNGGIDYP